MQTTDKLAYTAAEVARLMGLSPPTVTRLFEHEKGVLILERPAKMNKRRYRSMRVPRPVLERVLQRLTVRQSSNLRHALNGCRMNPECGGTLSSRMVRINKDGYLVVRCPTCRDHHTIVGGWNFREHLRRIHGMSKAAVTQLCNKAKGPRASGLIGVTCAR